MSIKLGGIGSGDVAATMNAVQDRGLRNAADQKANNFDQIKSYVSGLPGDAVLRVKYGSTTGELSLGKEGWWARTFKGERNELTTAVLKSAVEAKFGAGLASVFENKITMNGEGYKLTKADIAAAFSEIEQLAGRGNETGAFERKLIPDTTPEQTKADFVRYCPSKAEILTDVGDYSLHRGVVGDIINRGTVTLDNGMLKISRGRTDDHSVDTNLENILQFFEQKLGIDRNDKAQMNNTISNVLMFFDQNSYISPLGEGVQSQLGKNMGENNPRFTVTLTVADGKIHARRDAFVDNVSELVISRDGPYESKTGWRFTAGHSFDIPVDKALQSHTDFQPTDIENAARTEYFERGQREVSA